MGSGGGRSVYLCKLFFLAVLHALKDPLESKRKAKAAARRTDEAAFSDEKAA